MGNYISPISMDALSNLCGEIGDHNAINQKYFEKYQVKRGLRNPDGTGVMAGLTKICNVHGYMVNDGERLPVDGRLIYRGIDVMDIVGGCIEENRFGYEEVVWLLLFGNLPSEKQLSGLRSVLAQSRELPDDFIEDMIMKAPSPNIMNKLARSVMALYSYDSNPDDLSIPNVLRQSLQLISQMSTIMVYAYQVKRRHYYKQSMYLHPLDENDSTAQAILRALRNDCQFTDEEAKLLDLCLILHAEHGGGNNSTFATRVLSSSGTDTYSAIAAGIGSLKGPKHGGANIKVNEMLSYIKEGVQNYDDDEEIAAFLEKLLRKESGDHAGLIYGMGHAVYTYSDPRATILKNSAQKLAFEKGFGDDFKVLDAVERLTPDVFAKVKGDSKIICANVDLYSGLVYRVLGIPEDLFTPLFAVARIAGWCAHRIEEIMTGGRIIRPAYKSVATPQNYIPLKKRQNQLPKPPAEYIPAEERENKKHSKKVQP